MAERIWVDWGLQVHQAAGMITVQSTVDIFEALTLMIDHANATDRTLQQTAVEVVEGRLRFDGE